MEEDMLDDAILTLQVKSKGDILQTGVTAAPLHIPGVTTRAGRRKSEEGSMSKPKRKQKGTPIPAVEEWEECDDDITDLPPPCPPETHMEGAWMHTILIDIQKTQKEMLGKINTMYEQAQQDRQRMHNLELRVENLQKARMLGLTTQPLPQASTTPSSGTTPHTAGVPKGPFIL